MSRVIKKIEYNTRAISFRGTVVFAAMGKYVTDFLSRFHSPGFVITPITEEELDQSSSDRAAAEELQWVVEALDARNVPTEIAPGQPYTVHGRVLAALDKQAGASSPPVPEEK